MKKISLLLFVSAVILSSCLKEYSTEEGNDTGAGVIIGADCRINKITYTDSATGTGRGSISAAINNSDNVTDVTGFDSLTLTIDYNYLVQYFNDTVYIDPSQYFVRDATSKRINKFHGFIDPSVPASPQFDVEYVYDATGRLTEKFYYFSLAPTIPFMQASYTYTNGNATAVVLKDRFTGDIIRDATLAYYPNIAPKNFMYLFPDETLYPEFNQFFNFGTKSTNAVKNLKIRYYDPGNVVVDSSVSAFSNYILSRDNYVLSVEMAGDDQSTLPAVEGKLKFSYKCK
jgi:hypothetical protein